MRDRASAGFCEHTPFLEAGARATSTAFAIEKLGDVHVAWENEALRETAEAKGALQVVYPPLSILAEPVVAWVDTNVAKHRTEAAARAYLEFLFSESGQEIIAESGYRPFSVSALARHATRFPHLNLFSIKDIAKDWEEPHGSCRVLPRLARARASLEPSATGRRQLPGPAGTYNH